MTQKGIGALMTDMSEREKKTLFAGSVPIGLNRNQVCALDWSNRVYILDRSLVVLSCVWLASLLSRCRPFFFVTCW